MTLSHRPPRTHRQRRPATIQPERMCKWTFRSRSCTSNQRSQSGGNHNQTEVMGIAIGDLLHQTYRGLYLQATVGGLTIVAGASRRFYDTRLYSNIYCNASERVVRQKRAKEADVSVLSAHTSMARELVEFLENSLPEIVNCGVGVIGTLLMIWLLQATVFVHCLCATATIFSSTGSRQIARSASTKD